MSAVTSKGSARWIVYTGALDSDRLIEFLTRLIKQAGGRKVCLIVDNLRLHHRAPVKAWLAQPPAPRYAGQLHQQTPAQLRSCHWQPARVQSHVISPTTTYAA